MTTAVAQTPEAVRQRARASEGASEPAIYEMVGRILATRRPENRGVLLDVGCGTGALRSYVAPYCQAYRGADIVRYEQFPSDCAFTEIDLDQPSWPMDGPIADVTVAVETIEHLENPRAFVRQLVRLTRPGGLVIVTTPNQLSLLSKLSLVFRNEFVMFRKAPGLYPAHRTALLEIDLVRIADECGLTEIQTHFTNRGRIPGLALHWPRWPGGRPFSDNVAVSAVVPRADK